MNGQYLFGGTTKLLFFFVLNGDDFAFARAEKIYMVDSKAAAFVFVFLRKTWTLLLIKRSLQIISCIHSGANPRHTEHTVE
jgi:hypothetical protein